MTGSKRASSLRSAIEASGLVDGGTVSFHHHLRNGDGVLNLALDTLAGMGLGDLHIAASSIFPVHAPLAGHIEAGVVTRLTTSYLTGPAADAVAAGRLAHPATLQTHGGRARSISDGRVRIDLAIIAASAADDFGNLDGTIGPSAFGAMGYPMVDAAYARHVIALTDTLLPFPLPRIAIGGEHVDQVVVVPAIGRAAGIVSGTTLPADDPASLVIGDLAARVIDASGLLRDGFSFQAGAGGISLAASGALARVMTERGVTGGFASGGITGTTVTMHREGLFRALMDVQCFDLAAVASLRDNPAHHEMSALAYAAPGPRGAVVDRLDAVLLGAAEVDRDFNVNVTIGAGGRFIGGSGGHADTAEGARLTIVTTRLAAGAVPKLVDRVAHVTTPGSCVDVVVTEAGVAVNPRCPELAERLGRAGLPIRAIGSLCDPAPPRRTTEAHSGRVVAVSEDRHGRPVDRILAHRAGDENLP